MPGRQDMKPAVHGGTTLPSNDASLSSTNSRMRCSFVAACCAALKLLRISAHRQKFSRTYRRIGNRQRRRDTGDLRDQSGQNGTMQELDRVKKLLLVRRPCELSVKHAPGDDVSYNGEDSKVRSVPLDDLESRAKCRPRIKKTIKSSDFAVNAGEDRPRRDTRPELDNSLAADPPEMFFRCARASFAFDVFSASETGVSTARVAMSDLRERRRSAKSRDVRAPARLPEGQAAQEARAVAGFTICAITTSLDPTAWRVPRAGYEKNFSRRNDILIGVYRVPRGVTPDVTAVGARLLVL